MTATAPATPVAKRGFGPLPCPKCGQDACVTLRLDSMAEDDALHCCECDEGYALADVRTWIARWSVVLAWIDAAPEGGS